MKTVTFNDQTFSVNMLIVEQAEEIFAGSLKPAEMNRKVVEYSAYRTNGAALSPDEVRTMPWPCFKLLLAAALEVNGLAGEPQGAPAASSQTASAPVGA